MRDAIEWNKDRHTLDDTKLIQRKLNSWLTGSKLVEDGLWGPATVTALMNYQQHMQLTVDGKAGHQTLDALMNRSEMDQLQSIAVLLKFDLEVLTKTMLNTILHESSRSRFGAMNLDYEYEGWFDLPRKDKSGRSLNPAERANQPDHRPHNCSKYKPGSPGIHIGLSFGLIQFTQCGGALGEVLDQAFRIENKNKSLQLSDVLGGPSVVKELLSVTTSARPTSKGTPIRKAGARDSGLRSPRVQPVDGEDLWRGKWLERFKAASKLESVQKAQLIVAAVNYYLPAIKIVVDNCGDRPSMEDLAIAFDMSVQFGPAKAASMWKKAKEAWQLEYVCAEDVVNRMSKGDAVRRRTIMSKVNELEKIERSALQIVTKEELINLTLQLKL